MVQFLSHSAFLILIPISFAIAKMLTLKLFFHFSFLISSLLRAHMGTVDLNSSWASLSLILVRSPTRFGLFILITHSEIMCSVYCYQSELIPQMSFCNR